MDFSDQGDSSPYVSLFNPGSDFQYDFNVSGMNPHHHAGSHKDRVHRTDPLAMHGAVDDAEDAVHNIVLDPEDPDFLKPVLSGYEGDEVLGGESRGQGKRARSNAMTNGDAKVRGKAIGNRVGGVANEKGQGSGRMCYVKGMADDGALKDGGKHGQKTDKGVRKGKKDKGEDDDEVKQLKETGQIEEDTAKQKLEVKVSETAKETTEQKPAATDDSKSKTETKSEEKPKEEEKDKAKFKTRKMMTKIKTKFMAKVTDLRKL